MDNGSVSIYLARILSGSFIFKYLDKRYKLLYPNNTIKYEAEIYAQEEYEKNKYNDWISEEEKSFILNNIGLWNINSEKELKNIETKIEDLKIELYNSFLDPKKTKNIKKSISNHRNICGIYLYNKHYLDQLTHKGYINTVKNQYLLSQSLYDMQNNLVFKNFDNTDYYHMNNLCSVINNSQIQISSFRLVARSDEWKNYWSANKENIFGRPTTEWTDEQKTLVIFTKMYDSALEHPECPPKGVIEDDDMFDGWLLIQQRKSEKEKEKNRAEKLLEGKKIGNAKEVFLMAKSKEEAQNIYSLNDQTSSHIIKERNNIILKSGSDVKESDLPDVQRDLQIQNNQKFINSRKTK
jgi:hypothetical protein